MQTFSERLAALVLLLIGGLFCFTLLTVHDVVGLKSIEEPWGNYVQVESLFGEQSWCETKQTLSIQVIGGLEPGWSLVFENAGKCHVVQLTSWDLRHW